MKTQKKLNIALIILVIVLVSLISFVGIYHQDKNQMVSVLPDYILGTNVSGYRYVTLFPSEVQDKTESESLELGEVQVGDENSIEVENSDGNNTNTENVANENSTEDEEMSSKYEKAAELFKRRLKALKIEDFTVASDKKTGKIEIRLPENEQTDAVLSDLTQKGKFEISDTNTGEVLLTNNDVKNANVGITESYGYSIVGLTINFNLNGSKIFKNITEEYNPNATISENVMEDSETNTTNESSEENISNETAVEENALDENLTEDTTEENTIDESTEEEGKTEKTIDLKIDNTVMLSTSFSEVVDNGKLELTLGSYTNEDDLKSALYGGYNVAALVENEPLPVEYEVIGNIYVASPIRESNINILVYVLIGIFIVISIAMIIKFKMHGVLSTIFSIGYVALLLLAIRYTNVTLSLEGIFGIGLAFIINTAFYYLLFNKIKDKKLTREERIRNYNKTFKKYCLSIIPLIILSIVCCFINWDSIYSFGMVMFWAMGISILYNLIVTNFFIRSK